MYRYELHAHTSECDLAAHASGAELVRIYHAAGYSGMVITDHYFSFFAKITGLIFYPLRFTSANFSDRMDT